MAKKKNIDFLNDAIELRKSLTDADISNSNAVRALANMADTLIRDDLERDDVTNGRLALDFVTRAITMKRYHDDYS